MAQRKNTPGLADLLLKCMVDARPDAQHAGVAV